MKRASAFLSVTMIKHLKKDHPKAFLTGLEKNEQNKHWKSVTNLFSKSWNIKLETFLIKYFSIRSRKSWSNSNWNWKEILCVAWLEVVLYKSVTDTRSTSCQWKRCIRNLMVLSDWQEFIIWICIPPIITCDWYENGTCCIERSREISKNILCEEFHPIVIFIILMFASFHLDEGISLKFFWPCNFGDEWLHTWSFVDNSFKKEKKGFCFLCRSLPETQRATQLVIVHTFGHGPTALFKNLNHF